MLFSHFLKIGLDDLAAHIAGHDDDRILEIHHPSLIVRQPAVIQHLEQNIEHIRMRLFDLIQQHHAIRFAPDRLRQLSAFIISYISRRCANQPADRMFFLVFAHIDPGHHAFVIEQVVGQRLCQFRFTHTRRPKENKGSDRPPGILQSRPAPPDSIRYRA